MPLSSPSLSTFTNHHCRLRLLATVY